MTGSTPRAPLVPGTTDTYPVLPLRDIVVFPHMIVPLFVGREKSIRALEEVVKNDGLILLATQKNAGDDDPETKDIYEIGTLARVLQLLKLPDSTVKVLVEGVGRAKATAYVADEAFYQAEAVSLAEEEGKKVEVEALGRDTYDGDLFTTPDVGTVLTSNWSMLANLWRDFMITDRFGVYAGAGIGGGGYVLADRFPDGSRDVLGPGSALAWQGGGGLLWEITERLTFDVGYRYFAIDTIQQPFVPSGFGASELMFTLRLYEPFRAWRR